MKRDNIVQLLKDYRILCAKVEQLKVEIADIERNGVITKWIASDALSQLQSPQLTGMPHGSTVSSPTERIALQSPKPLTLSPGELDAKQNELFYLQRQAHATEIMLSCLYDKERFIIETHLIGGQSWQEVAKKHLERFGTYISERAMKYIQGTALDKMAELIGTA